jgi:hypothetical protein
MQKFKMTISVAIVAFFISSCGGGKETAASIAQKWCNLNGKAYKAEGAAKDAAMAAKDKFEKEMEGKYKNDKAFMDEIEKEVEKCEDASEGR